MTDLRIGSLFSGYGGLDLGVMLALGGRVVWHAEIDPAPARILAARFPGVPNLGDVTAVDWSTVESVDVLTGGFPCTDVSHIGRRLGLLPGTRSGLWSVMAYAIGRLRPRLVVIENVRGLLSARAGGEVEPCPWCLGDTGDGEPALRALGAVLADLADLGFDAEWVGSHATDVGALHERFRVFIVAWPAADADRLAPRQEPRGIRPAEVGERRAGTADDGAARDGGTGAAGRPAAPGVDALGLDPERVARWTAAVGRPAPEPAQPDGSLSPRFTEWLMGLPDGWVTGVGLSDSAALKALGNGVVPQQAAAAVAECLRSLPIESTREAAS